MEEVKHSNISSSAFSLLVSCAVKSWSLLKAFYFLQCFIAIFIHSHSSNLANCYNNNQCCNLSMAQDVNLTIVVCFIHWVMMLVLIAITD